MGITYIDGVMVGVHVIEPFILTQVNSTDLVLIPELVFIVPVSMKRIKLRRLEALVKTLKNSLSGDIKKLFEDFEEYEEMEEDVDSICDEIESIADKMRISDCEVTYTIQGNTNKGIPYFSIKVKVNGRLLCSYGIEPGEDMDRKRTSIMRSVKRYFDKVGSTDYIEL